MLADIFFNNIKILRRNTNLSQASFSKKISIERKRYAKWEEGRCQPDIDNIIAIANEHKISIDELLTKKL